MRSPEFKIDQMLWDEFKKFHNNIGSLFVKFDDGSFMLRNDYLRPDKRKTYNEYGFRIVRSNDPECRGMRFFSPDGERITAKALGNCELLWDIDANQAYSLEGIWAPSRWSDETRTYETLVGPNKIDLLPSYIRNSNRSVRFFMYGDGRKVSTPVRYSVPKKYNDEQEDYIKTTTNACKAWHMMVETKDPKWRFRPLPPNEIGWVSFSDMTEAQRRCIAFFGFARPHEEKWVSHLVVERKNNHLT